MKVAMTIAGLAMVVAMSTPARADDAANSGTRLVGALEACRAQPDAQRLACYDDAVAKLLSARTQGEVRIVDRATMQRTKRSLFGFSAIPPNLFGDSKGGAAEPDLKELTAAVTEAKPAGNGSWTFALADAGVWQSLTSSMFFEPRKGDQITVKAGILGHYTARIGKGRPVDVKRVR